MKGIHAVIVVVEPEPPAWHIAGEAGGFVGFEAAVFGECFRCVGGSMLQQQFPQMLPDFLISGILGQVVLFHGVFLKVKEQTMIPHRRVYQFDAALHDAEVPVQAVAEEDPVPGEGIWF